MTPDELERYRAARQSGDIVRVRNALCMNCIRSHIGRRPMFTGFVVDKQSGGMRRKLWSCATHDHMVVMGPAPARSAHLAAEARRTLDPKGSK